VPSLLHSRGLLAGAGSAASLIGAAVASLLFAAGLVAFTSWPAADGSSTPSVNLPAVPTTAGGVPTGAAGRASAAVTAGPAIVLPAAGAPARRGTARSIARIGGRGGSPAVPAGPSPTAASPPSGSAPSTPSAAEAPRNVTDDVADTTQAATNKVATTVGGPVGGAVDTTGDQVAQTVRDVGDSVQPVLGVLGG
jgi:hypothetical protein